jgi:hypothetical protein
VLSYLLSAVGNLNRETKLQKWTSYANLIFSSLGNFTLLYIFFDYSKPMDDVKIRLHNTTVHLKSGEVCFEKGRQKQIWRKSEMNLEV